MTAQPWYTKCVGFDVETGGVNVFTDRIVTASVVLVSPGSRPRAFTWIIDPGIGEIPKEASDIHGWTLERIRAHPEVRTPGDALFEIVGQLAYPMSHGVPLVAMNAAFDLSILEAECARHGVDTLASRLPGGRISPVVDPFVIDREHDRFRKGKRTLAALCEHHKVILAGAHSSDADALAAVRLVGRLCEKYPDLAAMDPHDLTRSQVSWHAQRQEDFANYLRKQGKDASDVNGEWPVRKAPAEVA